MARERSELGDSDTTGNGGLAAEIDGKDGLLHRRGYLKLAGAAATAVAATATVNGAEDYDVIRIGRGERRVINVGSGETFENKLIDCTASGARVTIIAKGTNWTIRNVGIDGYLDVGEPDAVFGVADTGGNTSTIENVYLGDGAANAGRSTAETAMWVDPKHSGHLDIRYVNVRGFSDNAIYASGPGGRGDGTVHIDRCFAANCRTAHYRIGSAGSKVTNSSVLLTNEGYDGRAVWVRKTGPCEVENCQLETNGRHYAIQAGAHDGGTSVTVSNTDYDTGFHGGYSERHGGRIRFADGVGNDPGAFVPEGVPTTPEAAASGRGGSTDGESTTERTESRHVFRFVGDGEPTDYYFEVEDGPVEPSTEGGAEIDEDFQWISEDGTRAAGRVIDGSHAWEFDALLTDVTVEGGADAIIDGNPSNLGRYPRDGASGDDWKGEMPWHDALENTIVVSGVGTDEATRYEFDVSGAVEKSTVNGASIDAEDRIADGTVNGTVGSWIDAFRFGGELEQLTVDGPATVRVNDEVVDPGEYGAAYPHTLTIVGQGVRSSYTITVDGEFDADDSVEEAIVTDTTAEGSIEHEVHRFDFSGTLTDVTFVDGKARVYLDDERIDPETYGDGPSLPHALVVDGSEASAPSTYSFTIDGEVAKAEYRSANINADDVIEDGTVRGGVVGWTDAYWFSGDIVDFTLLGDATVDVEHNVRDR